jgi:YHS domain-containing protein
MRKTLFSAALIVALSVSGPVLMAQQPEEVPDTEQKTAKSKDPVCKMMVLHDPDLSVDHDGRTYYFCMKKDLEAFEQDPEKYLEGEDHPHPDAHLDSLSR